MQTSEQAAMEKRFVLPYNWVKGAHTRHIGQKNGIWQIASDLAGTIAGKSVLDAGCGDGWYSAKMLKAGAHVTGADYSERGIRHANSIVEGATFVQASITKLPFPDQSFDAVFCFQVIEHIPPDDVPTAIAELARVTKRQGTLIVSVPSVRRRMSAAHFQHFSPEKFAALFAPHASSSLLVGQDERTPIRWLIERLIQNRVYTLERFGAWFNRTVFLRYYNRTSAERGDNLIIKVVRN